MADDHGVVELAIADVARELGARGGAERRVDPRLAGEPGEREHVGLVAIEVRDRRVPDRARAAEPGDQDDRPAMAMDLDRERGRRDRRRGGRIIVFRRAGGGVGACDGGEREDERAGEAHECTRAVHDSC